MYIQGRGVPQDDFMAVLQFSQAAFMGHAAAQNQLGLRYVMGRGISQDYTEAFKWFTKVAKQGDAEA